MAIGATMAAQQMGSFLSATMLSFWPVLLVLAGLAERLSQAKQASPYRGGLLIFVGILSQLAELIYAQIGMANSWPIGVIGGTLVHSVALLAGVNLDSLAVWVTFLPAAIILAGLLFLLSQMYENHGNVLRSTKTGAAHE